MIQVETFPTASEASNALNGQTAYLGGGTLVMRALNYGAQDFTRIVRTTDPAMRQIAGAGDRISIGAGVTMAEIVGSSDVAFLAPVAQSVGGPAVRNMATVGGNLFAGHPYGDFTAALLALDGTVRMANGSEQKLEDFLTGRDSVQGLVTSVSLMRPMGRDFRYRKISRVKPKGISVMSIAAWLPSSAGRLANPLVAFGAMGTTPLRAKGVEAALNGAVLDANGIRPALEAVARDFEPPDDAVASSWYRREVAPVHLRRLLLDEGAAQ